MKFFMILVFCIQFCNHTIFSQKTKSKWQNEVDLSFDPQLRHPARLSAFRQFDGKLLVVSQLDEINGVAVGGVGKKKLIRLNGNGTVDDTFYFNSEQYTDFVIFPLLDAKIIAQVKSANSAIKTIRLNSDGSLDTSFNCNYFNFPQGNSYFNIKKVLERNDGKLIVTGNFTIYLRTLPRQPKRVLTKGIALLNSDGSIDSSTRAFVENSSYQTISDAVLLANDQLVIKGDFTKIKNLNGTISYKNGFAKLNADGSVVEEFEPIIDAPFDIFPSTSQKFYVFGSFNKINGEPRTNIGRLNADGTVDTDFDYKSDPNFASIESIAVQNDGKLLLANKIITNLYYWGENRAIITRISENGIIDSSFDAPQIPFYQTSYENSFEILTNSNDDVYTINTAGKINGETRLGLALLNRDGSLSDSYLANLTSSNSGSNGSRTARSVAIQTDGKIIFAGNFSVFNGEWIHNNAAIDYRDSNRGIRLNADGALDTIFEFNKRGMSESIVRVDNQSRIIFFSSGTFKRFNPDGSIDPTFNSNYDLLSLQVFNMKTLPDGKLMISCSLGGYAPTPSGFPPLRFNENGSVDTTFQLNAPYSLNSTFRFQSFHNYGFDFDVEPDGKTIFGGYRYAQPATNEKLLPRFLPDGTLDQTFNISPYTIEYNQFISVDNIISKNDKIYISGTFSNGNSQNISYIRDLYRLNQSGTIEKKFGKKAENILLQSDDKIIFIGRDSLAEGDLNGLHRIDQDGVIDKSFTLLKNGGNAGNSTPGLRGSEMALQPDGNLVIIGNFDNVNGVRRVGIARLKMN